MPTYWPDLIRLSSLIPNLLPIGFHSPHLYTNPLIRIINGKTTQSTVLIITVIGFSSDYQGIYLNLIGRLIEMTS
jgi:hypothetical protein